MFRSLGVRGVRAAAFRAANRGWSKHWLPGGEVQVVEQCAPDGGAHVHAEHPGHPVGGEGHKEGVVQGGDRAVVLPPAHHPHLVGVQQFPGQVDKLPLPELAAETAHRNHSFPAPLGAS